MTGWSFFSEQITYICDHPVTIMPKATFENLDQKKKERIIDAFMAEFTSHRYDDASISRVVKKLGVAKGSIYQYFNDKLDLYLYLKSYCEQVKLQYIMHVRRQDFPDFWLYYRALFEAGVEFDLKSPRESKFLYCIAKNEHSPSVRDYHNEWRDQALKLFEVALQKEVDGGFLRADVPVKAMSFFLISASVHIGDYMQIFHGADFDKNVAEGKHVFAEQKDILLQSVDNFIKMLKNGFNTYN